MRRIVYRRRFRDRPILTALVASLLVTPISLLPGPGPAIASTPEVDHALVFDGADGSAAASGGDVIPTAGGAAFTVEAWVLDALANDGDFRHILSQGQGGTAFYLGTDEDTQEIRAGDSWTGTGVDLPVGRWVHVALTTPGDGSARLYLDGQLAVTKVTGFGGPTVSAVNGPFRLGTQRDLTQAWNGRIDTVRVWSVERTEVQIAQAMHRALPAGTAGLVTQYLANEGTGTTVRDTVSPGTINDLTLAGSASWATVATTTSVGTDLVVSFPRSAITAADGWTFPDGFATADLLVVGGGGGGGAWVGGGGGAGGMIEENSVAVTPGQTVRLTVGVGGRGAAKSSAGFTTANNGGSSSVGFAVIATGGGAGASWEDQQAGSGGSGGGGSRSGFLGAAGNPGQGNRGGDAGSSVQPHPAGGGGGAGGAGLAGSGSASGAGGPGRSSEITGIAVIYAGGGGGGSHGTWDDSSTFTSAGTTGVGGSGGGGDGAGATAAAQTVRAEDGTAGLGGGGGGAGNNCGTTCQTSIGGRGGSGVVIVRLTLAVANALEIGTQPVAGGASGGTLTTQPVVRIVDADGRLIVGDNTTTVTATITSGGGTLGGTTTVTAANGVASFSDLTLTAADGVDQVLRFTSTPALTSVDASAIRVATPAPPAPPGSDPDPIGPTPTAVPAGEGSASVWSSAVMLGTLAGLLALLGSGRLSRSSSRDRAPRRG